MFFEDTLEVHITGQVKKGFADTCVGAGTGLNGMFNLEASTIPIASTTALEYKSVSPKYYVLYLDKLIGFEEMIYLNFQESLNYPVLLMF